MIIVMFVVSAIITVGGAIYLVFVKKSRDFLKFLAVAFFVSAGVQMYLATAGIPAPFLGTSFVQTPGIGTFRAVPNPIFFLLTFYFSYIKNRKLRTNSGI